MNQVEMTRERGVCSETEEIGRVLSTGNIAGSCIYPKSIGK